MSRYHIELTDVDRRYLIAGVRDQNYFDQINRIVAAERIDFVHCQPDVEVEFWAGNRSRLHAKTLLPSAETIALCQDKMACNAKLREHHVAVPEAYFLASERDLEFALATLFRHHEKAWLRAIRGAGARAALPVKNLEHAKMWIDYWKVMRGLGYGDFMVSEFLPGREYAFQSIWRDGELLTSQARERIEYIFGHLTPSGQSSSPSVARTVWNEEVNALAERAIRAIDPHATGIFCVDLKEAADGTVRFMEVNAGRFFTTSFFFSTAGANMPYVYTKIGLGDPIPSNLPRFNAIPKDWYWVRMIDMGYRLVREGEWRSVAAASLPTVEACQDVVALGIRS